MNNGEQIQCAATNAMLYLVSFNQKPVQERGD